MTSAKRSQANPKVATAQTATTALRISSSFASMLTRMGQARCALACPVVQSLRCTNGGVEGFAVVHRRMVLIMGNADLYFALAGEAGIIGGSKQEVVNPSISSATAVGEQVCR